MSAILDGLGSPSRMGTWRLVVHPPSTILTCHNLFLGSHHPRRMTAPLNVTSQPVQWKNTSHSASTKVATERRLFMRPGRQCPCCASGGRLWRKRLAACVVVMQCPPGWMMVMLPWGLAVAFAGACGVRSMHDTAMSIKAVSLRLVGLAQPTESLLTWFAKFLHSTTSTSAVNSPAGLHCQVGGGGGVAFVGDRGSLCCTDSCP
jgi:hypothetical protein